MEPKGDIEFQITGELHFQKKEQIQFDQGAINLDQKPELVWLKLTDVRFLVGCIPGAEKIAEATETRATCVLRPGFAFVRGTLDVTIERTAISEEKRQVDYRMISKGIGSSSEVASSLNLTEQDGGTRVSWNCKIQKLGGLLKAVPQGLIRGAAQKTVSEVWEKFKSRLAEEAKE